MDRYYTRYVTLFVHSMTVAVACCVLAGCGPSETDKAANGDAKRQTTTAADPNAPPLPGGSASIPKDPNDRAAYGPDGKSIGGGGFKNQ